MKEKILLLLKGHYQFVVETLLIGCIGLVLSAQSNQLSRVANTIAGQANSLS